MMDRVPIERGLFLAISFACFSAGVTAQDTSGPAAQSPSGALGDEAYRLLKRFYDYDRGMPLEARVVGMEDFPGHTREKVVFRVRDSSVVAYLGIPKSGSPPYPCVLALHGATGDKADWWKQDGYTRGGRLTKALLDAGIAVFTPDARHHGERASDSVLETPAVMILERGWSSRARDMVVETIIEDRRALDYLETRPEIDATRIGVIGYSMGGIETFALTVLDSRVKVAVACVTPEWPDPALSPQGFAGALRDRPFLMQMARHDQFCTMTHAQRLYDLIPSLQKELILYDSDHRLPDEYIPKAAAWLLDGLNGKQGTGP
jgi:dienelactone hydrolase